MGLKEYGRKRRFDVTPEPPPQATGRSRRDALQFVVQKHRASRLHYDFRLEWNGTLLSWAVPKGPSTDPRVKRLAMAVEDHPLEYAGFEGVIPAGEYGGGTVMVWDRGTYTPASADVGRDLRSGEIKFTLHGEKLQGEWVLVRTGAADSRSWLLIKHGGGTAKGKEVLTDEPRSVLSNRLMSEIAFEEGGDVERAASADPRSEIEKLLRNARTRTRKPRAHPNIWRSKRNEVKPKAHEVKASPK